MLNWDQLIYYLLDDTMILKKEHQVDIIKKGKNNYWFYIEEMNILRVQKKIISV